MKLSALLLAIPSIALLSGCNQKDMYYTSNQPTTEAYYTNVRPSDSYYPSHTTVVTQTPVAPNTRMAHRHRHYKQQVAMQTAPDVTQTPPAPVDAQITNNDTSVTVTPAAPQ